MRRSLILTACVIGFMGTLSVPAFAETSFKATGFTVHNQWIVHQTDLKLDDGPANLVDDAANQIRYGYLDNEVDFVKLWQRWRDDKVPTVDFTKHFILVLTHPENAHVSIIGERDESGNLTLNSISTERLPNGMTYVIAVVSKDEIERFDGKSLWIVGCLSPA